MAEYIEREALAEFLKGEIQQCESELAESNGDDDRYEQAVESRMLGLVEAWRKVTNTASADVAEVVRCKECIHKVVTEDGEYNPEDIVCDYHMSDGFCENDFCSYGEKMDGRVGAE